MKSKSTFVRKTRAKNVDEIDTSLVIGHSTDNEIYARAYLSDQYR